MTTWSSNRLSSIIVSGRLGPHEIIITVLNQFVSVQMWFQLIDYFDSGL
jgi:hypothetical protein